jgi:hypothetical protein
MHRTQKPCNSRRTRCLGAESLEPRLLMHGGQELDYSLPRLAPVAPALNSLPAAPAALYLDFTGHFETRPFNGSSQLRSGAFDLDDNPASFNARERQIIERVWAAVAEDYAPFNINVTTVEPPSFANGVATRVVITGPDTVGAGGGSGIAADEVGSFTNPYANVAYVIADRVEEMLLEQLTPAIALDPRAEFDDLFALALGASASHEAGHGFGLRHQIALTYDGYLDPTRGGIYNEGTADWTPIMGQNVSIDRTTWHWGTTSHAVVSYSPNGTPWVQADQDDLSILSNAQNGFGYRPDDHGDTAATATRLYRAAISSQELAAWWGAGNDFGANGIIEQMSDVDVFSFRTTGGAVTVRLEVAEFAPNLDARLELWGPQGPIAAQPGQKVPQPIMRSDPAGALGAVITTTDLPAGEYTLVVRSHGQYGDLGQYTLRGDLNLPVDTGRVLDLPRLAEQTRPLQRPELEDPVAKFELETSPKTSSMDASGASTVGDTAFASQVDRAIQTARELDAMSESFELEATILRMALIRAAI